MATLKGIFAFIGFLMVPGFGQYVFEMQYFYQSCGSKQHLPWSRTTHGEYHLRISAENQVLPQFQGLKPCPPRLAALRGSSCPNYLPNTALSHVLVFLFPAHACWAFPFFCAWGGGGRDVHVFVFISNCDPTICNIPSEYACDSSNKPVRQALLSIPFNPGGNRGS